MTGKLDGDQVDLYFVVINDEEQYSIWRADTSVPNGWKSVDEPRPREQCLAYIDEAWIDMRPASLRRAMNEGLS